MFASCTRYLTKGSSTYPIVPSRNKKRASRSQSADVDSRSSNPPNLSNAERVISAVELHEITVLPSNITKSLNDPVSVDMRRQPTTCKSLSTTAIEHIT